MQQQVHRQATARCHTSSSIGPALRHRHPRIRWSDTKRFSSNTDAASGDDWQHRPDLNLVLVHPQIPQNAGNVARTCAATRVALHLVEPLGFDLDDKKLKRAGLDYWPYVCVNVHKSWEDFYKHFSDLEGPKRLVAYTVYGSSYYGGPEFTYRPGDWLVYGAETTGLPEQAHADVLGSGGALVKIPINTTHVRSLNLAVSVGIGVFEALRQLDSDHVVQPRDDSQLPQNQPYRPQAVLQDAGAAAAGPQ